MLKYANCSEAASQRSQDCSSVFKLLKDRRILSFESLVVILVGIVNIFDFDKFPLRH